jgi:hypothetical protein
MVHQEPSLSKNSTIYNYQLMVRVQHSTYKIIVYAAFIFGLAVYDIFQQSWLALLISYPAILIAHQLVTYYYFHFTNGGVMRGWTYRWEIFWTGTLPKGHSSIRLVKKVQLHIFGIVLVALLGMYPWISEQLLMNLVVTHIWLCFPKLWMLFRFRAHHSKGLIKITDKDTSCYLN